MAPSCSAYPMSETLNLQRDYESSNMFIRYVNHEILCFTVVEVRRPNHLLSPQEML